MNTQLGWKGARGAGEGFHVESGRELDERWSASSPSGTKLASPQCPLPQGCGRPSWIRGPRHRWRDDFLATYSSEASPRSRCGRRSAQTYADEAANERAYAKEVAPPSRRRRSSPLLTAWELPRHLITQPISSECDDLPAQTGRQPRPTPEICRLSNIT